MGELTRLQAFSAKKIDMFFFVVQAFPDRASLPVTSHFTFDHNFARLASELS
jgi:hypothetical protein